MKQTKLWLATAAVLLCGTTGMYAQAKKTTVPPPPVAISQTEVLLIEEGPMQVEANTAPSPTILSVDDGLLSTTSINEANGMRQYEYTSSVITLSDPSNVLYFTFLETHTEPQYVTNENKRQYPFVALSEFQIYDANGKEIELEASNFSSNAQEISEGPVADICDGNRSTYFHSTWSSQTSDYHYLRIELPDTLSAFSFKYYTRDWVRCIPKKIAIKGTHRYQVRDIELTKKDGLLSTISVNEKNNIAQYEYTSPVLTLKEPSNVLYFDFLEGHTMRSQYLLDKNGFPYMALAEFQLYDANGKEIKLEARNFSTNAPERVEGPIADICDGNRNTHFHSTWTAGASDYHHLRVALPDTLSAFSFKYYTRNTIQCIPERIGIRGAYYYDGHQYVSENQNPYNQTLAQGTCGENVSWKLMFGGHLIISGEGDMEIQGSRSPWEKLAVAKVTIEDGVTSISDHAFRFCSSLASVSIPASVIRIGSNNSYSRENPFSGCSNLSSIEVDASNPVFDSRENSNAIIRTGANALIVGCYTTRIPESVVSIEEEAFSGCYGLTSLYIPKSVTTIDKYAFSLCPLKTIIVAEDNPVYDSRGNCNAIIEKRSNTLVLGCAGTVIPTDVIKIGDMAFSNRDIESIAIPDNIVSIGDCAFAFSALSSIYIPQNVKKIHTGAFSFCSRLTSIVVDENNEVYDSRNGCNAIIETATNTLIKGSSSTIIPDGITKIGDYAFNNIFGLESVIIPESVSEIGRGAFESCINLTSITIPSGVTRIGHEAFIFCNKLTSIIIPKNVTEIDDEAFEYCSELTEAILPKHFKGREKEIFANCDKLKEIRYKNITLKQAKPTKQGKQTELTGESKAYVDLGLPSGTLWAAQNLGAKNPYDTGYYLAWGETKKKSTYSLKTYFDKQYEKFDTNSNPYLSGTEYDAATALWGEDWMMPTYEQANELYEHCTWKWTDNYDGSNVAGCICTGPNGNHIFFPAGGLMMDKKHAYTDCGNYWVGSLYRFNNIDWANFIDFNKNGTTQKYVSRDHRYWGRNVRAVKRD